MKRLVCAVCLSLIFFQTARAHKIEPASDYLPWTDAAYLVTVDSMIGKRIVFAVAETLKGQNRKSFSAIPEGNPSQFSSGSEWILIHMGGWKGHVGFKLEGDCEWIPAAVVHVNGVTYIKSEERPGITGTLDTLPDGSKGLTLDHVKERLAKTPAKT